MTYATAISKEIIVNAKGSQNNEWRFQNIGLRLPKKNKTKNC